MESENMQFDDTDLIFGQPTMQVPHQKPVESVTDFLQKIIQKDSIPKEELRKRWINMKSERDKMMKQYNKSKEQLAYYVSKIRIFVLMLSYPSCQGYLVCLLTP